MIKGKVLSVCCAIAIAIGATTAFAEKSAVLTQEVKQEAMLPFKDVSKQYKFYDAIAHVYSNNIMNGIALEEFAPDNTLTRAMLVTIMYRMEGEPASTNKFVFDDVLSGSYYENAVIWANGEKIVNGVSETSFAPDTNVTREQMSAIFYRYLTSKGIELKKIGTNISTLEDTNVADWAKEAVSACLANDIILDRDGKIEPTSDAKRAEAAQAIFAIHNLDGRAEITDPVVETMHKKPEDSFGNILIIGDSYSAIDGYIPTPPNYPWYMQGGQTSTDVTSVDEMWWKLIIDATPGSKLILDESSSGTTICNTGYSGSDNSTTSFIARLDKRIESGFFKENFIDTVFIMGGANDSWADSPVGKLKYSGWTDEDKKEVLPAISYMIGRIKEASPDTRIICVLPKVALRGEIIDGFIEACEHYGAEYVLVEETDLMSGHPTVSGMIQIKDKILETISFDK